jgi:hypothetical protein
MSPLGPSPSDYPQPNFYRTSSIQQHFAIINGGGTIFKNETDFEREESSLR